VETKYFKRKRRCRTYAAIDKSDDKNYNLVTRAMHLNAHSIIVNDWFFNSWSL